MSEFKTLTSRLKSADESGRASVVFCTMETIDHDGDWIQKGAFKNTKVVKVVGSHDWKSAPFGIANIREVGNEAIADIIFNLDMLSGLEWYKSIKFNHEHRAGQEFSFGFDVLDAEFATRNNKKVRVLKELDTFEVSPVLRGAGINTRTLAVKCTHCAAKDAFVVSAEVRELERQYKQREANRTLQSLELDWLYIDFMANESRIRRLALT